MGFRPDPLQSQTLLLEENSVTIRCGVGLHIGAAAVGAVVRGERTALGDAVNVAFRVEKLTRKLEEDMLVTADYLEDWPEGADWFEAKGIYELKGIDSEVKVFAPVE